MGVVKSYKRGVTKRVKSLKRKSKMINVFAPGLGTLLGNAAEAYLSMSKSAKSKLHKQKTTAAKKRVLKQYMK